MLQQLCMVVDGNLLYFGDHFIMFKNLELLCCTPEANMIPCVNYNSKKKIIAESVSNLSKSKFRFAYRLKKLSKPHLV